MPCWPRTSPPGGRCRRARPSRPSTPLSIRSTPGALRRSRKATCDRDVQFGSPSDEAGFTSMWARLYAPDAVVLQQRVEEMARSVCEDDPRTLGERRSEAWAAIAAGIAELACECGSSEGASAA